MIQYFNVNFEFNHQKLEDTVIKISKESKGYCCFIDLTSLVYSKNNSDFRNVLNSSVVNSCDGSYIAVIASKIYKKKLKQYTGPEFFEKFIYKDGNHLILGSTPNVFNKIIERVKSEGKNTDMISYLGLPFKNVGEFDYENIGRVINSKKPNYIWVSLGAPKQEYFMNKILPYIDNGILLGVGAAFNYFSGEIKDIPKWTKKLYLVWVYRLWTEPKKQIKRLKSIFLIFPKMILEERSKNNKTLQ